MKKSKSSRVAAVKQTSAPREPRPAPARVDTAPKLPFRLLEPSTVHFKHISSDGVMILRGNFAQTSRRFNWTSNNKQCAAVSVTAIAYATFRPPLNWHTDDVDAIVLSGDQLYRKTVAQNIVAQLGGRVRLCTLDINRTFCLLRRYCVTARLGDVVTSAVLDRHSVESVQKFTQTLVRFLDVTSACTVTFGGCTYAVLWTTDAETGGSRTFYVFNAHDADENGRPVADAQGTACVVRLPTLHATVDYFCATLFDGDADDGLYDIVSVEIRQIRELLAHPRPEVVPPIETASEMAPQPIDAAPALAPAPVAEPNLAHTLVKLPSIATTVDAVAIAPESYKSLDSGRGGALVGTAYTANADRVAMTSVAALIVLRTQRSQMWTGDTVDAIVALGKQIYGKEMKAATAAAERSSSPPLPQQLLITDIRLPISYAGHATGFKVRAEQLVFGELGSIIAHVADLETGVREFFRHADYGVLQGPQCVALWRETDRFYMFDAKERDRLGRKWTPLDNLEKHGAACVLWFDNLQDLVSVYTDNVPVRLRQSPYRIAKVDVLDAHDQSSSTPWFGWTAVVERRGRWILHGSYAQSSNRFSMVGQGGESGGTPTTSTAAAVFAILATDQPANWNRKTIDYILAAGKRYHAETVENLKALGKYGATVSAVDATSAADIASLPNATNFRIADINRWLNVRNTQFKFILNEDIVGGTADNLLGALRTFFARYKSGVLSTDTATLAIWREDDDDNDNRKAFYLFDSCVRGVAVQPPISQSPEGSGSMLPVVNLDTLPILEAPPGHGESDCGAAYAMRFVNLEDLADTVTVNLRRRPPQEFKIASIQTMAVNMDEPTPLHHYVQLLNRPNTGILRPTAEQLHEGHSSFDVHANHQTFCNLVTAIAFADINVSALWSGHDLDDILRMGDTLYKRLAGDQVPRRHDFRATVELVLHTGTRIGANTFTMTANETQGLFSKIVEPPAETPTAMAAKTKAPTKTKAPPKAPTPRVTLIKRLSLAEQKEPLLELTEALKLWTRVASVQAILESDVLSVALWKQDDHYFVFDPKIVTDTLVMTKNRLAAVDKRIAERKFKELAALTPPEPETTAQSVAGVSVVATPEKTPAGTASVAAAQKVTAAVKPGSSVKTAADKTSGPKTDVASAGKTDTSKDTHDPDDPLEDEDENEEGSAYVAWFQNLADLIDHILQLIPAAHKSERFRLHTLTVTNRLGVPISMTDPAEWDKFNLVQSGHWLLRGTLLQNELLFPEANRGNQDAANCVVALCFARLCAPSDWSIPLIDVVLRYGDRLYTISRAEARLTSGAHEKLNLLQIVSPFTIDMHKFTVRVRPIDCEVDAVMADVVAKLFADEANRFAVLCVENSYFALWQQSSDGADFFLFDPHSLGPLGEQRALGSAGLARFKDVQCLVRTLTINLPPTSSSAFALYALDIESEQELLRSICCTDAGHASARPNVSAFEEIHRHCRLLCGNTSASRPLVCYALAALAMARTVNVEFWAASHIDDILLFGDTLFEETVRSLSVDVGELFETLELSQYVRTFALGQNMVYVAVEPFRCGHVNPKESGMLTLAEGVDQLLTRCPATGILIVCELSVAVWRESDEFFCFYAQPIDRHGLLASNGQAGVMAFASVHLLCHYLIANIPPDEHDATFELWHCDFTIRTHTEGKPLSLRQRTHFRLLPNASWLLQGDTVSPASKRHDTRGMVSAILAVMQTTLIDPADWTASSVNDIIAHADKIYREAVAVHHTPTIDMRHLPSRFILNNSATLDVTFGDVSASLPMNVGRMEAELRTLFAHHTAGYLRADDAYFSMWRHNSFYYIFDAGLGRLRTPCVQRFGSLDALLSELGSVAVWNKISVRHIQVDLQRLEN